MKKIKISNKKAAVWATLTVLVGVGIVGFISHFFLGHENWVEEKAEDYIEEKIGIKFDMTPSTPEEL